MTGLMGGLQLGIFFGMLGPFPFLLEDPFLFFDVFNQGVGNDLTFPMCVNSLSGDSPVVKGDGFV